MPHSRLQGAFLQGLCSAALGEGHGAIASPSVSLSLSLSPSLSSCERNASESGLHHGLHKLFQTCSLDSAAAARRSSRVLRLTVKVMSERVQEESVKRFHAAFPFPEISSHEACAGSSLLCYLFVTFLFHLVLACLKLALP